MRPPGSVLVSLALLPLSFRGGEGFRDGGSWKPEAGEGREGFRDGGSWKSGAGEGREGFSDGGSWKSRAGEGREGFSDGGSWRVREGGGGGSGHCWFPGFAGLQGCSPVTHPRALPRGTRLRIEYYF